MGIYIVILLLSSLWFIWNNSFCQIPARYTSTAGNNRYLPITPGLLWPACRCWSTPRSTPSPCRGGRRTGPGPTGWRGAGAGPPSPAQHWHHGHHLPPGHQSHLWPGPRAGPGAVAVVGVSGSWCWRWWRCRTVAGGWRGHTAAVASGNVSGGHSGTLTTLDLYNLWIVQTADLCRVQVMTLMMLRLPLSVSPCPSPRSCPAADNNTLYTLIYSVQSQQDTTRRLSDAGGQQQPRARQALGSSVKTDNASIIWQ